MRSHLPGPPRFGAIIMVTVLSCVVLGAVWGLVISLLPDNTDPSATLPGSPPTQPRPIQSSATLNRDVLAATVQAPPPVMVKEQPSPASSFVERRPASEIASLPFGAELKCTMEIDALCPEDNEDRRLCLQRKAAQLPIPCRPILRERLVRMKEHLQQMRVACEGDRRQYCRDESLGGGAIVQCLESHAQEVSDQCFQFLPKRGRLLN
jgi:hypothetical protein